MPNDCAVNFSMQFLRNPVIRITGDNPVRKKNRSCISRFLRRCRSANVATSTLSFASRFSTLHHVHHFETKKTYSQITEATPIIITLHFPIMNANIQNKLRIDRESCTTLTTITKPWELLHIDLFGASRED